MTLSHFEKLDPNLLVGLVNTALRNDCEDLEDLARTHDIDRDRLESRLAEVGFSYVEETRSFRKRPGSE
ncbi:MAG: DUF4250 domain-containing protein [Verrucomicrobiota bacterium]